jgi:type I restriction enzyme S subunit
MGKKRELIEKLKEKRTALISRTVTRGLPAEAAVKTGLNPRPKLKPSGIEWLGDIPQDWEVTRLTFVTEKIGDGLHGTPVYSEESEIYFVNGNNLVDGKITFFENTREVSESVHEDYKLPLGPTTLLMSINGTIGNLAVYHGERIVLGKSAAFINCGRKLDRLFLFNLLHADGVKSFFNLELTGTTLSNLSLESVRKTPISLPPVPEQVAIVEYLTRETAKLDQMMEKVEAAIAKLQEYRTALITAAVTGKIDVRRKEV